MNQIRLIQGLAILSWLLLSVSAAQAAHGVSLDTALKYPAGFNHFDYVNPDAPKGGKLVLESLGSFD